MKRELSLDLTVPDPDDGKPWDLSKPEKQKMPWQPLKQPGGEK